MNRIITLTTDFGLSDEYVGVIKGVILARAPAAAIVDLSHFIPRHDIRRAALLIKSAYRYFPPATIHLIVVDPGVGSSRKLIMLQANDHFFLAPDNGVLSFILDQAEVQAIHEVQCEKYFLSPVSTTFHGRDILAPVAAEMAAGLAPETVGAAIAPEELQKLEITAARFDQAQHIMAGEITAIDHFGNLQTNITEHDLIYLLDSQKSSLTIRVKDRKIKGVRSAYNQEEPGGLLAIINSKGYLEIAVNQGSAAKLLAAAVMDRVTAAMS